MNMLRPATSDLLGPNDNRYSLVIATAKIARQLSEEAQEKKIPLEDKPVSLAVDLISKDKYKISPPDIENTDFEGIAQSETMTDDIEELKDEAFEEILFEETEQEDNE